MSSRATELTSIEVSTGSDPVASVIWLHGLGADGHDFEPIVPQLDLPADLPVRFVFPHAPVRPVTLNGGMSMPAWYDLYGLSMEHQEDEQGIRASAAAINQLIAVENARGIGADRVILAGFSQGGAVALYTGLRQAQPLAGVMALSTYIPLRDTIAEECDINLSPRSIFMAHGTQDAVLDCSMGRQTYSLLKQLGYDPEWHEYPMTHGVCPEEIRDISNWMMSLLK